MSRGSWWSAVAATVAVSLTLLGSIASTTVELSPPWVTVLWIVVVVLAGGTVLLATRKPRHEKPGAGRDQLPTAAAGTNNSLRDLNGVGMQAKTINQVVFQQPPAPATAVARWSVGRRPAPAGFFQHRTALDDLPAAIAAGWRGGMYVLHGLAGVGKTQIAAAYADSVRESGAATVLIWVDATSRDSILRGLSRAAEAILGANDSDVRCAADRILDWLDSTELPWLVVFDDLRCPRDMHDLWPPRTPHGQVVLTTRRRDSAVGVRDAHVIEVEPFTTDEAVAYLSEALAARPGQADGAAALAEAMGGHPLVLAQAVAYLAEHRDMTCATYQRLFHARLRVSRRRTERSGDHVAAIAAAWSLSIEHANQAAPRRLARPLLALVSMLHCHGVPAALFTSRAVLGYLRTEAKRAVSEQDVRDALSCLHRFGLITYEPTTPSRAVSVHALVQQIVFATLTWAGKLVAMRVVADALVTAWPQVESDSELAAVLRANAMALRGVVGIRLHDRSCRELMFRVGHSLGVSGQAAAAGDHFQDVVDAARRQCGARRHITRQARLSLARWRGEAGDLTGAVSEVDGLIQDAPRLFGRQRELTLKARRERARLRADAGDPVCAVAEANSVVGAFRRAYGEYHLETLYARNVQAHCLLVFGRPRWAAAVMDALVQDLLRHRDFDHPDLLCARNNLASMYHRAGEGTRAVHEYRTLLPDMYRVLGATHPNTLRTRNNAARCRIEAGDPTVSVAELQRLVDDCDRVLGPAHPETLGAWSNLSRSFAGACGQ